MKKIMFVLVLMLTSCHERCNDGDAANDVRSITNEEAVCDWSNGRYLCYTSTGRTFSCPRDNRESCLEMNVEVK